MIRFLWGSLFLLFCSYTAVVYLRCDSKKKEAPLSKHISSGGRSWREHNCQSCHQLYGLGGYLGPDLTNTATLKGAPYMRSFIRYGSGRMPNFHLNDSEINNLVIFLGWVNESGRSKVSASQVRWTGNYQLD